MSLFFTRDENLPPGADDRNVRPIKEPDDYLSPMEEEEIEDVIRCECGCNERINRGYAYQRIWENRPHYFKTYKHFKLWELINDEVKG